MLTIYKAVIDYRNKKISAPTLRKITKLCKQYVNEEISGRELANLAGQLDIAEDMAKIRGDTRTPVPPYQVVLLATGTYPKCLECGGDVDYNRNKRAFSEFCSRACMSSSPIIKERRAANNIEKYGVANVFELPSVKKKAKRTIKVKYGVSNVSKADEIKEKKRRTVRKNYGVDHPSQSEVIKERKRQTSIENYGVGHYMQSDEGKANFKKACLEIYGVDHPAKSLRVQQRRMQTCMEIYGVPYHISSDKVRDNIRKTVRDRYGVDYITQAEVFIHTVQESMMERYGVRFAAQVPEVMDKILQSRKEKSLERYGVEHWLQVPEHFQSVVEKNLKLKRHEVGGKVFNCLGYEPQVLDYLHHEIGIPVKDITTSQKHIRNIPYKYAGSNRWFFPDIMFRKGKHKHIVEVKSEWTFFKEVDKNRAKMVGVLKALDSIGVTSFCFLVVNKKGEILARIKTLKEFDKYTK